MIPFLKINCFYTASKNVVNTNVQDYLWRKGKLLFWPFTN